MSGIFGQLGIIKEVGAAATITGITGVAGTPNTGTVAATAHGYRAGDVITLSGFTPSGWNGTFTILSVPTANSFVISTGTTSVSNSSVQGTVTLATKFGGGGTVSRFFEIAAPGETLQYERGRVVSNAITANRLYKRADRFAVYGKGGTGDINLEVLSKGFAYWLAPMGFSVAQTGPTDTAAYTYTATPATYLGQSVAVQVGRPYSLSNIVQPFNYLGVKILSWTLSNTVDGILMLKLTVSIQNEVVNVALAVPSYPTGAELLTFVGGAFTLNSVTIATAKNITITANLGQTAPQDRRFINAAGLPQEPLTNNWRDVTWSADVEFIDMTAYNRYLSSTAAGTMTAFSAAWSGPSIITGAASTVASFTVTAPNARLDAPQTPNITGPALLTQKLTGPFLNTAATSDDAMQIVIVSGDTTA